MGVCTSNEAATVQYETTFEKPKEEDRPPMAIEHKTYDYRLAKEEQDDEKIAVVCCPHAIGYNVDRISLVDIDPKSETYCKFIYELPLNSSGDEPGRINWTKSAGSLHDMQKACSMDRKYIVVPCMNSSKIYVVEVMANSLRIEKEIPSESLLRKDVSCPYSIHSLPLKGAPVHISTLGDRSGHGKGDFVLLDRNTWEIRRKNDAEFSNFGGDFGMQPRHNLIIGCELGQPRLLRNGLSKSDLENESLGSKLHVWQVSPPRLKQTIELDPFDGCLTSTVRFLHNADCNHAFACSAVGATLFHLHMDTLSEYWTANKVVQFAALKVDNWQSEELPALLTDMVISMDDHWLFLAGYLHGIIWKVDIQDPFRATVHCRIKLGGVLESFPDVAVKVTSTLDDTWWLRPDKKSVRPRGETFRGGPASLQLSKDGRRLYVCNSFYKAWDAQFFPDLLSRGGQMVKVDVDDDVMNLDPNFLIDLKDHPEGPFVIRDVRFFGGDCTSDNFL